VSRTREKSKGRKGGERDRFARIPEVVMESEALVRASHPAFRALAILLVGNAEGRNGTLMCSESYAAKYGIKSHGAVKRALQELLDHQLIILTRRVQPLRRFPALYAVTWWPVHNRDGQPVAPPEPATHAYADWEPPITPTAREWNFKKKKKSSPLPQGDNTPTPRVKKLLHHPDLGAEPTNPHPYLKADSQILEGDPSLDGNGQPILNGDAPSNFVPENCSKTRASQSKEKKPPLDHRIGIALREFPGADDEYISKLSGTSLEDVQRQRAAVAGKS
jgi:hypothetical protein